MSSKGNPGTSYHPVTPPITSCVATLYFSALDPELGAKIFRHQGRFLVYSARSSTLNMSSLAPAGTWRASVLGLPYHSPLQLPGASPGAQQPCPDTQLTGTGTPPVSGNSQVPQPPSQGLRDPAPRTAQPLGDAPRRAAGAGGPRPEPPLGPSGGARPRQPPPRGAKGTTPRSAAGRPSWGSQALAARGEGWGDPRPEPSPASPARPGPAHLRPAPP